MSLRKAWAEKAGMERGSLRPEGAGGGAPLLSAGRHLGLGPRDHSPPRHRPPQVPGLGAQPEERPPTPAAEVQPAAIPACRGPQGQG